MAFFPFHLLDSFFPQIINFNPTPENDYHKRSKGHLFLLRWIMDSYPMVSTYLPVPHHGTIVPEVSQNQTVNIRHTYTIRPATQTAQHDHYHLPQFFLKSYLIPGQDHYIPVRFLSRSCSGSCQRALCSSQNNKS